ncbi:MAG: tRNA (adenosine(37)-N6)-dimethylallyltransferase MiaA [Chloroflexota bacterium]
MDYLIVIIGPTGIGKSRLGLLLAQHYDGEIIGADSRQIYRHMNIGTAKPTPEELALVPHHMVNIINPDEDFSLARYQKLALQAITGTQQRGKLALLVGGSGQYVWSIIEGWGIPPVAPDQPFRQEMEERAARGEGDELYQELARVDPTAAGRIDKHNLRRVIRALEVQHHTQAPLSRLQSKQAPPFRTLILGLTADRAELYRMIDQRVDRMMADGLVAEVEKLLDMGYGFDLPAMSGIGYKQIGQLLRGELTLASAVQQIKNETHRFVRQQYNWFQPNDKRIKWIDIQNGAESAIAAALSDFAGDR